MTPYRATAAEPWAGWATSRAAQAAYGEHLARVTRLIWGLLYGQAMDRKELALAYEQGDPEKILYIVQEQAMELRDELLETAVALDVLALCQPSDSYLPRPYVETSPDGPDWSDELPTDASDVASDLASHDLLHGTSRTGDIPPALQDGCTEAERDALRAYVRREWLAREGHY